MTTFFAIFLVLLVINVALLIFSNSKLNLKISKFNRKITNQSPSKIYPLNLSSSKYKKAI